MPLFMYLLYPTEFIRVVCWEWVASISQSMGDYTNDYIVEEDGIASPGNH